MPLTSKQERFIKEYLVDGNATQAAIRAGYAGGKSAEVTGHRLLRDAKIASAIEGERARLAKRVDLTVTGTLTRLEKLYEYQSEMIQDRNDDGEPVGEPYMRNPNGARMILEMQGRYLGMWNGEGRNANNEERPETPEERQIRNKELGEVVQLFRKSRLELQNKRMEHPHQRK